MSFSQSGVIPCYLVLFAARLHSITPFRFPYYNPHETWQLTGGVVVSHPRLRPLLSVILLLLLFGSLVGCSDSKTDNVSTDKLSMSFSKIKLSNAPAPAPDAGWVWQNPLPNGTQLRHVTLLPNSTGWAVGDAGPY